jgi:hypothetical protein
MKSTLGLILEQLKKYCSHSVRRGAKAVFLVFGFVLAQSQAFANLILRQSLGQNLKILAPNWLQYFFNCSWFTD